MTPHPGVAHPVTTGEALVDTFHRVHDNLRISVTDRCNIRCFYCMPEDGVQFQPRQEILSFEEITRFVRIAADLGITKLRLTGGEPLVRKDLPQLVEMLARLPGIRDIALTTNAVLLKEMAGPLRRAGLHRLNIHLDTLCPTKFQQITRRDEFARVMEGIDAAQTEGFPVKLNAVAVKGLVEDDIAPLARFGRERGIEVRYIEFMPLDAQGIWDRNGVLSASAMLEILSREVGPLEEIPHRDLRAPATEYRFLDGVGTVGFIASVTRPFCLNCNRIRLTADGHLRYCLFAIEETDVKRLLRGGACDADIADTVRDTVRRKWIGHEINSANFVPPPRPMYAIGG
ncbi:MAG: GTP 3',8-cyclase MoaA [Bryobacterales bacterium]|nr:GTP 3',8-cyclase MoaA [Bryobacterales bacterium]